MARSLRKHKLDGTPYFRRDKVEFEIQALAEISAAELERRADLWQVNDPEFVSPEALLYFVRNAAAGAHRDKLGAPFEVVAQQMLDALLLPAIQVAAEADPVEIPLNDKQRDAAPSAWTSVADSTKLGCCIGGKHPRANFRRRRTRLQKATPTHIDRITAIVEDPANEKERAAFNTFAGELRDDLNGSISDGEVIEMLAQHLITKPVFDALFEDYSFAQHNPMSLAMQGVLEVLQEHRLDKEADTLQRFYDSVKMRAAGIDNAAGKQKIVVELYDKFFRNAFPKMTERLGIVYTPVEVVDFIIHSVAHILKTEFGQTLGSKGVHIIDPFTGTGTFITRLLQSGLIAPEHLPHKYKHET